MVLVCSLDGLFGELSLEILVVYIDGSYCRKPWLLCSLDGPFRELSRSIIGGYYVCELKTAGLYTILGLRSCCAGLFLLHSQSLC